MGNFFGSIYCWFEDWFGIELANYLWGQSSPLSETNSYISIGFSMLGISFGIMILYYYVIDHPRLSNWWGWGIFLALNAIVNFIIGWQIVLNDYYDGKMVTIDPSTNLQTPLNIGESEIVCFGLSNMILSILAFFIFSIALKWWSRRSSHTPF